MSAEMNHWPENKNAFRAVLRPRRRLNLSCAVDCALQWAGDYVHPGKQLATTSGGSSAPPIQESPQRQL